MTLALDGSVATGVGPTTTHVSVTTTHSPGRIIFLAAYRYNGSNNTDQISSVATTGLTWTLRKRYRQNPNYGNTLVLEEWSAVANTTLSGATVTPTFSATPDYLVMFGFGVYDSGGQNVVYDTNASVPAVAVDSGAASSSFSSSVPTVTGVSTTATNTFTFGFVSTSLNSDMGTSVDSGYTLLSHQGDSESNEIWTAGEYQVLSSALSNQTITEGSAVLGWQMLVDSLTTSTGQTGTWASTEADDLMFFREDPHGPWASTENDDTMLFGQVPTLDAYAKNGHGSSTPFGSNTVTLTTHYNNELIILYSVAGSLNTEGFITSITDTAGLTWTKRQRRTQFGIRPVVEIWWAVAPTPLTSDVITVNYSPSVGGSDLWALGIAGANNAAPFDTHTLAGGMIDNFDSGNPTANISTFANNSLILAFYSSNTIDIAQPTGQITSPFNYVDALNTTVPTAGVLYSDFSYYYASAPQTNLTAQYGNFGGTANERAIMFDSIVAAGETGTADEVRWFLDAGFFGGGNAFFTGEFVNGNFFGTTTVNTYNSGDVILVAALLQNSSGAGQVSSISMAGVSPGFTRRSRVTDASGTLALEVWWAWAPSALSVGGGTNITVNCSGVANNSDLLTYIVFAVNGPNLPSFAPDWDPDVSLPATAFSDSGANVQVPGIYTESPNALMLAFTGNEQIDTTGTETAPFLPGYHFVSGAPPSYLNFEYFFSAPVVTNLTAQWTNTPTNPSVWVAVADALDVGPPSPPVGTWASTEHADKMTGAPAQAPYLSIGWLGWVPLYLTVSLTEGKDFPTGAPAQAPYDSIGWLGWVPAYLTWVSVEFQDRFSGHAWVLGQPLTGQWHSTEHDDLMDTPWANPPYTHPTGYMTIAETDDRWASAGFELPTAVPAPQRTRRVVIVT